MKNLPSAKSLAISETIGFMALTGSLLLIQGFSRLLMKNL